MIERSPSATRHEEGPKELKTAIRELTGLAPGCIEPIAATESARLYRARLMDDRVLCLSYDVRRGSVGRVNTEGIAAYTDLTVGLILWKLPLERAQLRRFFPYLHELLDVESVLLTIRTLLQYLDEEDRRRTSEMLYSRPPKNRWARVLLNSGRSIATTQSAPVLGVFRAPME